MIWNSSRPLSIRWSILSPLWKKQTRTSYWAKEGLIVYRVDQIHYHKQMPQLWTIIVHLFSNSFSSRYSSTKSEGEVWLHMVIILGKITAIISRLRIWWRISRLTLQLSFCRIMQLELRVHTNYDTIHNIRIHLFRKLNYTRCHPSKVTTATSSKWAALHFRNANRANRLIAMPSHKVSTSWISNRRWGKLKE